MTSQYFKNSYKVFNPSLLSEASPNKEEAVIVIGNTSNIKAVALPENELRRAAAITHHSSRDRYLAGRYLVRGILSQWLAMKPEDITIALSDLGKPFLPHHHFHFSISHTEQAVAAVFSIQSSGIDLEQERTLDALALARRFFSPEEADFLSQTQSLPEFFRLWCCREAAIKGDGRGLGGLLNATRPILPASDDCVQVFVGGVEWNVFPWLMKGGIHGAAAFQTLPSVIRWCDLADPLG
jgi:phosphopantetheinyl transferase